MESTTITTTTSCPPNGRSESNILVLAGFKPAGQHASSTPDREMESNTEIIVMHLLDQVPEFRRLADLRRKGWESPAGNKHFKKQRRNADKTDADTSRYHFHLMKKIANELHHATTGFAARFFPGSILDMCAAPGGFLATAIRINPDAEVVAFSLPPSDGGYNVLLPLDKMQCVDFLDVTMLAADMGVTVIPPDHPDAGKFLPRQLPEMRSFDLVLCDGQVLRTHERASYRELREPLRLKTTQLSLGLEHLRPRGTMVVLLHKIEAWDTVCILRTFSKFSSMRVHKPTAGHTARSSFYMVATGVDSQHPEAIEAVEKWKAVWRAATFGTDEEFAEALRGGEPSAEEMWDEFGHELVTNGKGVWNVQADALVNAQFTKS
ncbi:FtsJ-like methyltransferase family protein [Apiospora rasikravindrae]|uniref:FtsJ-like methyltransferase family protein n=1 Tax=Apiospora rasikravindrae TaxID=990691 RepID=A0ABR1SCH8_9PEZI